MPQIKRSAVINHHVAQHHAAAHILLHTQFRSVQSLSPVRLFATLWTAAYQTSPSTGFSRQEYWSVLLVPSPIYIYDILKMFESVFLLPMRLFLLSFQNAIKKK